MPQDSRITYIISQLGELRELLLLIDRSGEETPGILLKLAKEKAEEINRSTRDLRTSDFWAGLQNHDPFTECSTPCENESVTTESAPNPEVAQETKTPKEEIPLETDEPLHEAAIEENMEETVPKDTTIAPELPDEQPETDSNPDTAEPEEEILYPWEQLDGETPSDGSYDNDENDDADYEESDEDYDEPDIYDEPSEEAGDSDTTSGPVTLEEALQRQQAKELRKALSLNDRFRFRRELFGNSDIRMNETLVLIDAMSSYEGAEDYILNDLNWDIENPEVAEFMKIVQKHFL